MPRHAAVTGTILLAATLTGPSVADPPRARAVWTSIREIGDPPPAVTGHVVVDGRLVGGIDDQGDFLLDDWQRTQSGYGPATWEEAFGGPSPVIDAAGGTHRGDDFSMVFGGRLDSNVFGDTWILRNGTWSLSSAAGPSARHRHAMASGGNAIFMHGGLGTPGPFGDWQPIDDVFWKFDGDAWLPLDQLGGLPSRFDHAMVSLPSGELVIQGGRMGDPDAPLDLADTWRYDGVGWSMIARKGGPTGAGIAMRYDDVVDAVVAHKDGHTWLLRDDEWHRVETDPSGSGDPAAGFVFDSESGGVAFGGADLLSGGRVLTLVRRPSNDCDGDGIDDDVQIADGAWDCNHDGVLDDCQLANGAPDCDGNGILDACDVAPTYTSGSAAFQVRYGWQSPFHDQIAISRFEVSPGGESISTVWYPYSPIGSSRPDVMRLGIWRDSGSGFIEDATLLAEIPVDIPARSGQWARFDFDPVAVGAAGTRFFVGVASRRNSPGAPCISVYVRRNAAAPIGGDAGWVGITSGIFDFDDMGREVGSSQFITNLVSYDAPYEASVATLQMRVGPANPLDEDGDFTLDRCVGTCDGDLDGNGVVGGGDLGLLFTQWGPCPGCDADLNGDGFVRGDDLGLFFILWGPCP